MEIKQNESKKEWEDFLSKNRCNFLQSTLWGDFKEKYQKVERIEAKDRENILGVCQFFEEKSLFGNYLYIPYGPISKTKKIRDDLVKEVLKRGKESNKMFLRVEPLEEITGGRKQFSRVQPQKTLVSNINKPIEEIIQEFHSTTRYNVRYAKRKGVIIERGGSVNAFFKLLQKTKERHGFQSYSKEYFENLLQVPGSELVSAVYDGEIIAATILFYFNKTVSFLHSASDYNKRSLKAPALIRFESIEHAKVNGCTHYDFWGIDEKRFLGVTTYKKGFGGTEIIYPEGRDFPIKNICYFLYKTTVKIKNQIK